jgi:hypothetical protein
MYFASFLNLSMLPGAVNDLLILHVRDISINKVPAATAIKTGIDLIQS